jgi:hypothetical protein
MLGSTITQDLLYDRVETCASGTSNGSVDPNLDPGRPKKCPKKRETFRNFMLKSSRLGWGGLARCLKVICRGLRRHR